VCFCSSWCSHGESIDQWMVLTKFSSLAHCIHFSFFCVEASSSCSSSVHHKNNTHCPTASSAATTQYYHDNFYTARLQVMGIKFTVFLAHPHHLVVGPIGTRWTSHFGRTTLFKLTCLCPSILLPCIQHNNLLILPFSL
jgi:hypothetical protein